MKSAAARFMADMFHQREPYCLTLLGPSGTGKSHLARLVAAFFERYMSHHQDRGLKDGLWRCAGGFVDWGGALRGMLDRGEWSRMASYRHDFFVVLDDIMAEHEKLRELSASKLFDVLEARQGKRWTILTANCDLQTISNRLDARISSRIVRDRNKWCVLPSNTQDYAFRKI